MTLTDSRIQRTLLLLCFTVFAKFVSAEVPAKTETPQSEIAPIERLGEEAAKAQQQFYEYDNTIPLEPRIVEKIERDGTVREKIVFRGAQGFLVPGFLEYPAGERGPYPCVLLLHGWSGSKEHWWRDGGYISGGNVRTAFLSAGYAVLALDAQIHGDRISQNDFAPVNHFVDPAAGKDQRKGYFTLTEIYVQTTRDYRRAIDYLETRKEIIGSRIGMLGYSMGGTQTFLLTGVETRIKASVACCTPAERSKWSQVAPQNFAAGIGDRPFLMIMGRTDEMCSADHARGLYALIPSPTKELVFIEAGHRLPVDYVPYAIQWMRKYL